MRILIRCAKLTILSITVLCSVYIMEIIVKTCANSNTKRMLFQSHSYSCFKGNAYTITSTRSDEGVLSLSLKTIYNQSHYGCLNSSSSHEKDDFLLDKRNFPALTDKEWKKLCEFEPIPEMNLIKTKPISFHPDFKNPCWYEELDTGNKGNRRVIRCLPYFYLLGIKKSGTTDLFSRIRSHPDFVSMTMKESHWFSYKRFFKKLSSINYYATNMTGGAATRIENYTVPKNGRKFHPLITGDATPAHLYVSNYWPKWPGNEGCVEPKITNYDLIRHLTPQAKILLIVRDPVERYYSDYFHLKFLLKEKPSKDDFHENALNGSNAFLRCVQYAPLRNCVYKAVNTFAELRFELNLYYVFVKDIFRVFPRNQVLVLNQNVYTLCMKETLRKVYTFLDLRDVDEEKMNKIVSQQVVNVRKTKLETGPMRNDTRKLLYRLFKPYNAELAMLLRDDSFRFLHPTPDGLKC